MEIAGLIVYFIFLSCVWWVLMFKISLTVSMDSENIDHLKTIIGPALSKYCENPTWLFVGMYTGTCVMTAYSMIKATFYLSPFIILPIYIYWKY